MSDGLTVWINTRCPVCDAGIAWQRHRLMPALRAGQIVFCDINLEPTALASFGVTVNDVRRRLHAVDGAGHLLVGIDVVIAIWRLTPGQMWMAAVVAHPAVHGLAGFVYDRFADLLFAWNRWCGRW